MNKEKIVFDVLHDLPEWFEIESAVQEYAKILKLCLSLLLKIKAFKL